MSQDPERILVSSPFIACPSCGKPEHNIPSNFPLNYFLEEPFFCSGCGKGIDLWSVALDTMMQGSALFSQGAAVFLGAQMHIIKKIVPLLGHIEIDLEQHGVPEDSIILYVNYTPGTIDHAYIPLNWHGNVPFPRKIPRKLFIYGVPMPLGKAREIRPEAKFNDITIMVTFLPHGADDHAMKNLGKAYKAFLDDDYEEMIIPAHVAVEDTLKQCITLFCEIHDIGNGDQKWDTMMNHTLPLISDRYGLPRLTNSISELGHKLYGLRNMLAHNGKIKSELTLTKEKAAERLCAAIFITRYILSLKALLQAK